MMTQSLSLKRVEISRLLGQNLSENSYDDENSSHFAAIVVNYGTWMP